MTILVLIFAEIIPKTIGTNCWRSLMGFTTRVISILVIIMFPLVILAEKLTKLISPKESEAAVSREEVSAMANVAEEAGDLEEDENAIIQNVINMDELTVADVMTPRVVVAMAPEKMMVKHFYKDKRFFHHSRIPVYANDDEYITGYILRIEALQMMAEDKHDVTLGELRRDIPSFQEDTTLDVVWDEMLGKDEQIAAVINEYGSFQGVVSLEDMIETLLGSEIVDEYDTVRDMQQFARERWERIQTARRKSESKKN